MKDTFALLKQVYAKKIKNLVPEVDKAPPPSAPLPGETKAPPKNAHNRYEKLMKILRKEAEK